MKIISLFLLSFVTLLANSQIVNIPDANFKNALVNYNVADFDGDWIPDGDVDTNDDGEIQMSEAEIVLGLYVSGKEIASLVGIEAFVNIFALDVFNNNLTNLDVATAPNLLWLDCSSNNLIFLNVSENLELESLNFNFNNLTSVDITQNLNLKILFCLFNDLTTLNVEQNILLERLECTENELSSLNLSSNIGLKTLICDGNNIGMLDLSQNLLLELLNCSSNPLTDLDISQNTNLIQVWCYNMLLTTLDVSQNTNLSFLYCQRNQLTSLDISENIMGYLDCSINNLSNLNLKNGYNFALVYLDASGNNDLICIQVDDSDFANNQPECDFNSGWCKDPWSVYSEFCKLGMEDYVDNSLAIYPNPVVEMFQIQNNGNWEIASLMLYDALGRLVLVETKVFNWVDVSSLKSGIYFLKIQTAFGEVTKKVIKK